MFALKTKQIVPFHLSANTKCSNGLFRALQSYLKLLIKWKSLRRTPNFAPHRHIMHARLRKHSLH